MIKTTRLSKSYGEAIVVDGVDLAIARGGLTGIIGPNGAGKSTLLGLIARLLDADAGTVTVDGLDVTRTPGDVLARRLSVLRQDNHIAARLTVRDLVGFGRYPHCKGRLRSVDLEKVEQALDYMQLAPLAGRYLDELSGGQRQRAHVAMVLCQDTDYMLFDEPLNSLDIRHAVWIMRLLRNAARDLGKTIVVVLHDINVAARFCDRIVAMKDGRIACHGVADEVVTAPMLSEIYELPVEVHMIAGRRIVDWLD